MISRAEAKRREKQSARDKARHRRELEEQERQRRQRQSHQDRTGHYKTQTWPHWSSFAPPTASPPAIPREDTASSPPEESVVKSEAEATTSEEMASLPVEKDFFGQFCEQTAQMFHSLNLADAKVLIGNVEFPVHRFVLCLQSKYFANALNGDYAEGKTKTLNCPSEKEHAYLRLLQYLYTGDYDEDPSSLIEMEDDHELLKHPQVYFLADSFDLDNLKKVALDKFESTLDNLWLSERLVDCIAEVYSNTSSGVQDPMRAAIVHICVARISKLLPGKAFLSLIEKGGDFAINLTQALALNQRQAKSRADY